MSKQLDIQFHGWLGDDLLTSFPCYFATPKLVKILEDNGATGIVLAPMTFSISYEYKTFFPDQLLPQFVWLKIVGIEGVDDFAITTGKRRILLISERIFTIMAANRVLELCEVKLQKR